MQSIRIKLANEEQTQALGLCLAKLLQAPQIIFLQGELGAGKTTLVKGLLRGLGHQGSTKSPTYTLVEPYQLNDLNAYHFDLYRLSDPEELEFIGIREYIADKAILLFEWPEKGAGILPQPDWLIHLQYEGEQRIAQIEGKSTDLLQKLEKLADIVPKS